MIFSLFYQVFIIHFCLFFWFTWHGSIQFHQVEKYNEQFCNLVLRIFEFRFSSNYRRILSFLIYEFIVQNDIFVVLSSVYYQIFAFFLRLLDMAVQWHMGEVSSSWIMKRNGGNLTGVELQTTVLGKPQKKSFLSDRTTKRGG